MKDDSTKLTSPEPIPASIRALLACPKCHGALVDGNGGNELRCDACKLAFPVRDGIPVMLIDAATKFAP